LICSAPATEVPPNFITTISALFARVAIAG
jgi:hypothetical protein